MQQMPTEGRLFREVDGTWRQIMAACVAAPKALEVGWRDAKLIKLPYYSGGFIEPTLMLVPRMRQKWHGVRWKYYSE